NPSLFVVAFSNFMDETAKLADLILPVQLPLESWDLYEGKTHLKSTLQPAMGKLSGAPAIGDVFLNAAYDKGKSEINFKTYLFKRLVSNGTVSDESGWIRAFQKGGIFSNGSKGKIKPKQIVPDGFPGERTSLGTAQGDGPVLIAAPSIRFYDGRGANQPWLCEIPDPLTKIAWQTPLSMHPHTLKRYGLGQGDVVKIESKYGSLEAPVYQTEIVRPDILMMNIGQGHGGYGRYAKNVGRNPLQLLPPDPEKDSGGPVFLVGPVTIQKTHRSQKLANTDGSRFQDNRKIALSVSLDVLTKDKKPQKHGLTMHDFPLTLPLPEGYDPVRDFYPPHAHEDYRWSMVVDLDKCIGCNACSVACYAENNLGVVGEDQIIKGREMSWMRIERYHEPLDMKKVTFLPMLCQHCDNAPCESVCPVYAPHHSKEGLNNQIYNRCIGTRFCSQNCPYKVRRFNWFGGKWTKPLNLQLNPNVTVRSKGVMEKCSFCIQRIKEAHGIAKNEKRKIRDGEIVPACAQTCPTGAIVFGNLMDNESRVRKLVENPRAYQVMGYLNTKPAVIYLKKVIQKV
ncbi:4Fe-4S dicluster domain-containing protein, partial [Thermodesulfobacteriota bacterium]